MVLCPTPFPQAVVVCGTSSCHAAAHGASATGRLQTEDAEASCPAPCGGQTLTGCPGLAVQQRRCMVPAPRLQIKDAQGEERDVLQGLLSLQDAEVALPLDPSGAPCRLSR